jgi:hypothetical protein
MKRNEDCSRIPLMALVAVIGLSGSPARGADSPADFVLQRDRAGLVHLGVSRKELQEITYDLMRMESSFMDQHRNSVEIYLPGDAQENTSRRPPASIVVNLDGNRPDSGVVREVYVRDPRFRTAEGLGPASTLGNIRALHPDLVIKHEVVHESFDGMKPGDALAEVHHPHTVIDGVRYLLRPANYLKYRPSDGLPDNTPVYMARISDYSIAESRK